MEWEWIGKEEKGRIGEGEPPLFWAHREEGKHLDTFLWMKRDKGRGNASGGWFKVLGPKQHKSNANIHMYSILPPPLYYHLILFVVF
jgi:hypothetical protein